MRERTGRSLMKQKNENIAQMRNATQKEHESVNQYIERISEDTGFSISMERKEVEKDTRMTEVRKDPIYAITCFTRFEETDLGWPNFGDTAFMGFYYDKETAIECVKNNACDIAETIYGYAVVEDIPPGMYAYPRPRWFFKYDREKDMYEEIEEPEFMKHIANVL